MDNAKFAILPWSYDEIIDMFQMLESGKLLTAEEYNTLVNEKGIKNLITNLDIDGLLKLIEEIKDSKMSKEEYYIIQSKLNQMIRINEKQEEGNFELIDIRNGADGKVYLTAGEAVRTQFRNLVDRVEPIKDTNILQDQHIAQLRRDSDDLLEEFNTVRDNVQDISEKNQLAIDELKQIESDQETRIRSIERNNARQQAYLNSLMGTGELSRLGKIEIKLDNDSYEPLMNPNYKNGEGMLDIKAIKGTTKFKGIDEFDTHLNSYSTFEDFYNMTNEKYEVTIAIIDHSDINRGDYIYDSIQLQLSTPLLEYDEIVYYENKGVCHVHKTDINEELQEVYEITNRALIDIEVLIPNNDKNEKLNPLSLYITSNCSISLQNALFEEPMHSSVAPKTIIFYYDALSVNTASLADSIDYVEDQNLELMAMNWDIKYRTYEVQWALEDANISINKEDDTMFSIVEIAKKLIAANKYIKNVFINQLERYRYKGIITEKEYNELINMIK